MTRPHPMLLFPIAGFALLCAGCRPEPAETSQQQLLELASLRGLRDSQLPALRDELAQLELEQATPRLLQASQPAPAENAMAAFTEFLHEDFLPSVHSQAESYFPPGRFRFDPFRLEQVISLRRKHDDRRRKARQALASDWQFTVDFERGFAADRSWIDAVALYVFLEAYYAAEQLAAEQPDEAVVTVEAMLSVVGRLSATPHVEARLTAVELREKTYRVLAEICAGATEPRHFQRLRQAIEAQLSAWPDDARAWIGDRAHALLAYEAIRAGHVEALLTPDEAQQFQAEGLLEALPGAAARVIDEDQQYYLQAMRDVIAACEQPFHQRQPRLESIREDLHRRRNDADFPFIAARLFLPYLESAQRQQALDRARTEAWAVALREASGDRTEIPVNPLTGKPYEVLREPSRIVVQPDATGDEYIIVPLPDAASSSRRRDWAPRRSGR